jgi:hypothetical protein
MAGAEAVTEVEEEETETTGVTTAKDHSNLTMLTIIVVTKILPNKLKPNRTQKTN